MNGVLNINKPAGMTSHDVVARIRRLLNEKKVGHTGTLDPDATGVLPVCLGKATKIIQFIQDYEKGYEGTIVLGIGTDTLDASGEILDISGCANVTSGDVESVFGSFVGEMDQIPPMVSAIKVQGTRLYKLARQGKTVSRKPRRIFIHELKLLDLRAATHEVVFSDAEHTVPCIELDFQVMCSRGTYVRSLAADIGESLGCGAYLSRLIRIKSGIFELKNSIELEEIQADSQKALTAMQSMDDVLPHIPVIVITDFARKGFVNGIPVEGAGIDQYGSEFHAGDVIRVHDGAGTLLGLGRAMTEHIPDAATEAADPRAIICKVEKMLKET